ncbi:MAG: hypothetical protein WC584_01780 [Candidatus Pacearchaeota archaeon]
MDEKENETKYLGRKKDGGLVDSDVYEVTSSRGTRIVEVKSITELMRQYNKPKR